MAIQFIATKLTGAYLIEPERFEDERGFFAPCFSQQELIERGLEARFVEAGISYNLKKHTIRGMHFQSPPDSQAKLVRCTKGAIYDVIIDLRPESASYGQWEAAELTQQNRLTFHIPEGFAHGFQTLEDMTEVFYQFSKNYAPLSECGVRWNDAAFNIDWPEKEHITINERDGNFPDFRPSR